MSRVYWHTKDDGEAELRGSERAYAGCMVTDLFLALLDGVGQHDDLPSSPSPLRRLIPPGTYLDACARGAAWVQAARLWLGASYDGQMVLPDGRRSDAWTVGLNTALALGSPPIQLLARIHAQCEIHGWIAGPDRAGVADIIDAGRESHILRDGQGWEDVTALLRKGDAGNVFLSYSVCDQFPNEGAAHYLPPTWEGPKDWYDLPEPAIREWVEAHKAPAREVYGAAENDPYYAAHPEKAVELVPTREAYPDQEGEGGWYTLTNEEQWRLAEEQVTGGHASLRIRPDDLAGQSFGDGLTAFDLNRIMAEPQTAVTNR